MLDIFSGILQTRNVLKDALGEKKMKMFAKYLIVICACILTVSIFAGCRPDNPEDPEDPENETPAYWGVYTLSLNGSLEDVPELMGVATIEFVDDTIVLTMPAGFGGEQVFDEFTLDGSDDSDIYNIHQDKQDKNDDWMIVTKVSIARCFNTERLRVEYSHVVLTPDDESEMALRMEFVHTSGDLYTADVAIDTSGSSIMFFDIKEDNAVGVEEIWTLGTTFFNGTYTLVGNVIRIYRANELIFVGTLVNNNSIRIELIDSDNGDFATMVLERNVFHEGNTVILSK